jgi:hypothetical protein
MIMAVDPSMIEDFSNALMSNGIVNWIVGKIEKTEPGLVKVSENVEYIEVTKI